MSDIFALQDEITLKIVDALKVTLLPSETKAIQATPTANVEAYTCCLRGREFLNMHYQRYYPLARNMFAKAVEIDPSFAAAYAGIADCDSYSFLTRKDPATIASMLDNSAKAIELDPGLAAAHASRGLAYWGAGEPARAEADYMKSLELDPEPLRGQLLLRPILPGDGRSRPGRRTVRARRRSTADRLQVRRPSAKRLRVARAEGCGRARAAAVAWNGPSASFSRARKMPIAAMHAAMALAALGDKDRAMHFLQWAMSTEADDPSMLFNAACTYSRLGELEAALDLLEKVHPLIPPADQAWTATDPDLLPLHGLPRFQALIASTAVKL